jgi:DNA/RNA endonuclease G (NUC1)
VNLGSLVGFDQNLDKGGPHQTAAAWYAGTADLSPSQIPDENGQTIYRRLGDLAQGETPWYVPDHTNANLSNFGNESAPWEGIGTGWFNSILGGGSELRPYDVNGKKSKQELGDFDEYLQSRRLPITYDNTYTGQPVGSRLRGDYAVPTLFNGNFDSVTAKFEEQNHSIPGWSYSGSGSQSIPNNVLQKNLIAWDEIPSFQKSERDKFGYGTFIPKSFALQMGGGQGTTAQHNPFIVPDWGVLRLDLHVPESSVSNNGKLKIHIEPLDSSVSSQTGEILLRKAQNKTQIITPTASRMPASYGDDRYKIGYGLQGFETFHIDIDRELRGQPATLRLELEGTEPIYLDNIFFKSESLKWGNPTEARAELNSQYENNYLIEKPQYSLSYNASKNTINWVSWKLNQSWFGSASRSGLGFGEDPALDNTGWDRVKHVDYNANYLQDKNGQAVENVQKDDYGDPILDPETGEPIPIIRIDRGHLAPAADRTRTRKDVLATFLSTNILPQQQTNNRGIWRTLEKHIQDVVKRPPNGGHLDTYIIAGGFEVNQQYNGISQNDSLDPLIHLPRGLWKVALTVGDNINEPPTTSHYGVYMGNEPRSDWQQFTINIEELEKLLSADNTIPFQYEFLTSNVTASESQTIKGNNKIIFPSPG